MDWPWRFLSLFSQNQNFTGMRVKSDYKIVASQKWEPGTWAKPVLIDAERCRRAQKNLRLYHKWFEKSEAVVPYQWLFQEWGTGHEENADEIQRFVGKDCASEQLPIAQIPEMVICADSNHRTARAAHKGCWTPSSGSKGNHAFLSRRKEVVSSIKGVENTLSIYPCV